MKKGQNPQRRLKRDLRKIFFASRYCYYCELWAAVFLPSEYLLTGRNRKIYVKSWNRSGLEAVIISSYCCIDYDCRLLKCKTSYRRRKTKVTFYNLRQSPGFVWLKINFYDRALGAIFMKVRLGCICSDSKQWVEGFSSFSILSKTDWREQKDRGENIGSICQVLKDDFRVIWILLLCQLTRDFNGGNTCSEEIGIRHSISCGLLPLGLVQASNELPVFLSLVLNRCCYRERTSTQIYRSD